MAGAKPNASGHLVAEEADDPGGGEDPEAGEVLGVDEALDAFIEGDECARKDREHDRTAGPPLGAGTAQEKGDANRHRGEGVPCVVYEIGEQCHAARREVDQELRDRGDAEHRQAQPHRAQAGARPHDRPVEQTVAVPMPMPVVMGVVVSAGVAMGVRPCVSMSVLDVRTVTV